MHLCSACQKQPASIVIMDLSGGSVTGQQHLCQTCAEGLGVVQSNIPLKLSPELLEDLLGTVKGSPSANSPQRKRDQTCPGCGMSPQDFAQKGRLGCARCYETFRLDLVPLLQRVHEATSHRGRLPGGKPSGMPINIPTASPTAKAAQGKARGEHVVDLRHKLDEAIRGERFEEAAKLRDQLRRAEKGEPLS